MTNLIAASLIVLLVLLIYALVHRHVRMMATLRANIILILIQDGREWRMVDLWNAVTKSCGKEPSLGALYAAVDRLDADGVTCSVHKLADGRSQRFVRRIV